MIEYVLSAAAGVAFGVFTGIVPGIHANTVVFISLPLYFRYQPSMMIYMSFVSAVSVSHTFHDFLPSIFFGLAEAETALAALPGPEMASRGKGLQAFAYTVYGGMLSVAGFAVAFPLLFALIEPVYRSLSPYMFWILLFFLAFAVFRSDDLVSAVTVAALSGSLGILTFGSNVNQSYALMPVFSGLFSVPAIVNGLSSNLEIPEQDEEVRRAFDLEGTTLGFLSGLVAGILPGIGSAISTSFFAPLMHNRKRFLSAMGAINTSDIFVSFLALMVIGKSRSGASVALSYITSFSYPQAVFLVSVSVFAAGLSVLSAFGVAERFLVLLKNLEFSHVLIAASAILAAVTATLTGLLGVLILLTSSCVGYAASLRDQRKVCMAVLIVPAMRFYATGLTL